MRSSLLTILVLSSLSTLSVAHDENNPIEELSPYSSQILQVADTESLDERSLGTVVNATPLAAKRLSAQGFNPVINPALKNPAGVSLVQWLLDKLTDPFDISEFLGGVDFTGTV